MRRQKKKRSFKENILLFFIIILCSSFSFSYFISSFYSFPFLLILALSSLLFIGIYFKIKTSIPFLPFLSLLAIFFSNKINLYNKNIFFASLFIVSSGIFVFLITRLIDFSVVSKKFRIKSSFTSYFILVTLSIFYILIFTFLLFGRHYRLMTGLDLAGFNQALWNTLQGRPLETFLYGKNFLGMHLSPILILLAPFYFIWQDTRILLILQSLFLGSATIPIYLIAHHRLKDRFISLVFSFCYLLHPFLSRINLTDFHEIDIAIPLLLWTFLFLVKRSFKLYLVFLFLSLMVKEDVSLAGIGLGLYAFFRVNRKIGAITFIASFVWLFLAMKILIPIIREKTSIYQEEKTEYEYLVRYQHLGKSLNEMAKTVILHPLPVFKTILSPNKLITIFLLFLPFAFLSLAGPFLLLPLIFNLLLHLLAYFKVQYLLLWQYSALIVPFVVISSIYGFGNITERFKKKLQIAMPLCLSLLTISILSNISFSESPFIQESFDSEKYNPKNHKNFLFSIPVDLKIPENEKARIELFYEIKKIIPKDAKLSCDSPFGAHLSERRYLFPFIPGYIRFEDSEYILIDKSQRDLNFGLLLEGLKKLEEDKRFFLIFEETQGDGFTIYIRKEKIGEFLEKAYKLANSNKESPYSHFILSSILFHIGKNDEALKSAEKVIQIKPSYYKETPWLIMGDIYLVKGNLNEAYRVYKKAVDIEPIKVVKLVDVMNAYASQGKKTELIKKEIDNVILSIKEKERLGLDNIFFKKQLAYIYANMGQHREAVSYLKEILLLEPNDPWANELFNNLKNFP